MTNIQRNFQKAIELYQVKAPFLPPKISWKLDLILYMVHGNQPNEQLLSDQQLLEYEDLQNLSVQNLKLIFNNIVDILLGKQTVSSKKCQIKKKGLFTNWMEANIHYDKSNFILSCSNKAYTYEKENVGIQKSRDSKREFDLFYKGTHKYNIKFQNSDQMKSIWHAWQRQIIDAKTKRNYQQMRTMVDMQVEESFMDRISLFEIRLPKAKSPQKINLSPQPRTSNPYLNSFNISKQLSQISPNKKLVQNQSINLKPVPHDFICKLKGNKSIIAVSRDDEPRIYIEHIFSGKLQQKRLLSFLLLQKSWNSFLVMEMVQKTQKPNQILICRKYDTFKQLGQFAEMTIKATYSSWNSNMSIITLESDLVQNRNASLNCNSVITVESDSSKVRILIEEQLTSRKHDKQKLKRILLEMYKEIIKLDLIHQKVVFRDFDAQTIIVNMLQDEQSTNNESGQDIGFYLVKNQSEQKQETNYFQETVEKIPKIRKQVINQQILKLKSPLQKVSLQYIQCVMNGEYEKNYFKYRFSQQILDTYEKYAPFYIIDKLLQNKIYEVTPTRDLKFIHQELLDGQKDILRFILKQIGANLISGKSILNVSLPVGIFEPRSALQRLAASFGYCPDYLIVGAQKTTLEQIKYVISMLMSVVTLQLIQQKPFNPILGETFQGYIKGIPIFIEQISHHPPVSAYYMKCPQFTLYGKFVPFIDVGLNTGVGGNLGAVNVIFKNGSHFQCYFPPSEISGLLYGDRKFRCYNRAYIFQKKSRLYSQFSIQNQKKGVYESPTKLKGGQIIGGIYKVKKQFIDQIQKYRGQHKNLKKFSGLTKEMIEQKYNTISGQWFGKILIDDKVINDNFQAYPVQYAKNVLPSDSNFRLDVLYHRIKDLNRSQKQKQVLEIIQRNDRKLREKYAGK